VTTRDPPLLSERDGEGYASDLGQAGNKIFLQRGLDEALVWSGRSQPLVLVALHPAASAAVIAGHGHQIARGNFRVPVRGARIHAGSGAEMPIMPEAPLRAAGAHDQADGDA
jgi:hypothetical protein